MRPLFASILQMLRSSSFDTALRARRHTRIGLGQESIDLMLSYKRCGECSMSLSHDCFSLTEIRHLSRHRLRGFISIWRLCCSLPRHPLQQPLFVLSKASWNTRITSLWSCFGNKKKEGMSSGTACKKQLRTLKRTYPTQLWQADSQFWRSPVCGSVTEKPGYMQGIYIYICKYYTYVKWNRCKYLFIYIMQGIYIYIYIYMQGIYIYICIYFQETNVVCIHVDCSDRLP